MSDKFSWQNSTDPRENLPTDEKREKERGTEEIYIYIYILYTALTQCILYASHIPSKLEISLSFYLYLYLFLSWKYNELLQQFVILPFMRASRLVLDALFNAAIHLFSDSIVFSPLSLFPSVFTSPVITVISTRCAHIRLLSCFRYDGVEGLISTD